MADQMKQPPIGRTHKELGEALNRGMSKLRGRLFTFVECANLGEVQEEAFKALVREETTRFWTDFERLMAEKLCRLVEGEVDRE